MFTRSCTAIAPFSIENGVMPNAVWSIASVPFTTSSSADLLHARDGTNGAGGSMQRHRGPDLPVSVAGAETVHADQGERVPLGVQHLGQHVAAGALDVVGIRLRIEASARPQRGLVDDQRCRAARRSRHGLRPGAMAPITSWLATT